MTATARAVRAGSESRGAKFRASFITAGLVAALVGPLAGSAAAAQVTPTVVPGNPRCSTLLSGSFDVSATVNDPSPGETTTNFTFDGQTGSVTVNRTNSSFNFTFSSGFEAAGVIVKGGPNANFYDYTPIGGVASDTGLNAPINPNNGRPYGISHIEFCIDEAPQTGALRIRKTSTKGDNPLVQSAGASFEATGPGGTITATDNGGGDDDPTVGEVCVEDVAVGDYTVTETAPPTTGYGPGTAVEDTATVVSGTDCSGNPPAEADAAEFSNPPLADGTVTLAGQNDETTNRIVCLDDEGNEIADSGEGNSVGVDLPDLEPAADGGPREYTCTLTVDP